MSAIAGGSANAPNNGTSELLNLGYIKYTLVNESTQHRLSLWRRRTQRPIIRDGYRLSD